MRLSSSPPLHSNPAYSSSMPTTRIDFDDSQGHSNTHSNHCYNRRRCKTGKLYQMTLLISMLLVLSMPNSTSAKYRLVPKTKKMNNNNNNNNNNKHGFFNHEKNTNSKTHDNQKNDKTHNNNQKNDKTRNNKQKNDKRQTHSKRETKIVLQPKQGIAKNEPKPAVLKLEATISKNEKGDQVLMLSPESTQQVHSVMHEQSQQQEEAIKSESQPVLTMALQQEDAPAAGAVEPDKEEVVYFYDPEELKTGAGDEPPIPKQVFDEHGNEVDLAGKEALLIKPSVEVDQEHVEGKKSNKGNIKSSSSSSTSRENIQTILDSPPQTQDQMIIITTVATMALLVGALSARRLRSRQFLSFCIENESLEDELAYDAAYTTQGTGGLYGHGGGSSGGGYDTFVSGKYGGDLRWRGDLEKFDV